jgi:hypothetical protein
LRGRFGFCLEIVRLSPKSTGARCTGIYPIAAEEKCHAQVFVSGYVYR